MKKQIWKKAVAMMLSFLMIFNVGGGFTPQNVKAEEQNLEISLTADDYELSRGDTVTYTVSMANNTEAGGLNLTLEYDTDALTLQSCAKGRAFDDATVSDLNDETEGKVTAVIASLNVLHNGTVLTATFKVNNTASGALNVKIADGVEVLDANFDVIDCDIAMDKVAEVKVPATAVSLNKSKTTVDVGKTEQLTATVTPADSTDKCTWKSSNTAVATVSGTGLVTGVAEGTAKITVTAGAKTATCDVTVVKNIPLQSIEIKGDTDTIKKGQSTQLSVVYTPADTTVDKTVTWTSSKPAVATVDATGKVVAVAEGTTTITAKVGDKTDTYDITVAEIHLTGISVAETASIHKGKTQKLTVTYNPSNTTDDKTVTWTSGDTTVATVAADGTVTAVAPGNTVITAKVGEFTDTCTVTVYVTLTDIVPAKTAVELIKNQTYDITYTVAPADTTDSKDVTYTTSDAAVATVDANGKVTAKKAGTADITLTGANNVKAVVKVTVKEIPINELVMSAVNKTVEAGDTAALEVTIKPADNTDDDQTITWKSSDESVATVTVDSADSKKATVTAVAGGTATITATAANGTKAECTIKVPKHMESISLPATAEVLAKATKTLDVTINPADTDDDKTVTWSTSDETIATVDAATGMITGIKEGTVTITATTVAVNADTNQPFTAATTLTVIENHVTDVVAGDITFEAEETEQFLKGESINLNDYLNLEEVLEENNITDEVTVEWSTSDETIATVDEAGVVQFVKDGDVKFTAKIIAKSASGSTVEYTKELAITVELLPLESISFENPVATMYVGDIATLTVVYNPTNTTDDKTVEWESSDDTVIKVEDGKITALKAGKATITATVGKGTDNEKVTETTVSVVIRWVPDYDDDEDETETETTPGGTTTTPNKKPTTNTKVEEKEETTETEVVETETTEEIEVVTETTEETEKVEEVVETESGDTSDTTVSGTEETKSSNMGLIAVLGVVALAAVGVVIFVKSGKKK